MVRLGKELSNDYSVYHSVHWSQFGKNGSKHGNELPGLGIHVDTWSEPMDQHELVAHRINELVKSGFAHEEIVVISRRGMDNSAFKHCDQLGTTPLRRFTREYTADGKQICTEGKLYFDTIYRLKGQQAPAVILVDIDETIDESDLSRRILYCGMTRATVRLELLVHKSNPWLERLREVGASDSG